MANDITPLPAAERAHALKLIWRHTHADFKGKLDGERSILVLRGSTTLVPLNDLTDAEIADKWPYVAKCEERRLAAAVQKLKGGAA